MSSLGQAKTLGGVGGLLVLIGGFVGSAGGVVSIIGFILVLVAVKYVADVLADQKVFNNMIIAVVMTIIGFVALIAIVLGSFSSFIGFGMFSFTPGMTPSIGLVNFLITILVAWEVACVFFLIASIFLKRSYDTVGTRLNIGMFHTTGLLYLIGAALSFIFVGVIVIFIAEILQIVAFFSIPEQMPMGPQPMPGQMGTFPPSSGTI
jgi:uncharacterized membrane protein